MNGEVYDFYCWTEDDDNAVKRKSMMGPETAAREHAAAIFDLRSLTSIEKKSVSVTVIVVDVEGEKIRRFSVEASLDSNPLAG